jgi:GT2 family glycosyltransferase
MTSAVRVLISLVNWNGGASIVRCLEQLRAQTFPNAHVIVIDNASTDGSVAAIRQADPGVLVVENADNLGYAGGNNVALRYGLREDFDYFWLLNYDTRSEPDTLAALVDMAESDPTIGAISPVIYKSEQLDQIQFCGTWAELRTCRFRDARNFSEMDTHQSSSRNDLLLWGTALFLRREAIQAAGLLDERYFAYYEDLDLTDRILRAGFRNRVSPAARIWHGGIPSIHDRPPYYTYFNIRNDHLFWRDRVTMTGKLRQLRLFAKRTLHFTSELKGRASAPEQLEACVCGFRDALLGRYGRWGPARRPPQWLYVLMTAHPDALGALLDGRFLCLLTSVIAKIRHTLRPQ